MTLMHQQSWAQMSRRDRYMPRMAGARALCEVSHAAPRTLLSTDRLFTRSGRNGSRKNATRAVRATRRFLVTVLLLSSSSFRAAFGGFAFLGFSGSLHTGGAGQVSNIMRRPGALAGQAEPDWKACVEC